MQKKIEITLVFYVLFDGVFNIACFIFLDKNKAQDFLNLRFYLSLRHIV